MLSSLWHRLAVAVMVNWATALPSFYQSPGNTSILLNLVGRQDDEYFDETDLSFIIKLAAIGDSYSAGIGAGDRLGTLLDVLDPHGGMFDILEFSRLDQLPRWSQIRANMAVKTGLAVATIMPIPILSTTTQDWEIRPTESSSSSHALGQ